MRLLHLIMLAVLVAALSACSDKGNSPEDEEDTTASHTVLVYMAAENSLSRFAYSDIGEMLQARSALTDNDRLIIYLDNTEYPRLFEVTRQTTASTLSDLTPVVTYSWELNSASAATLDEILEYTVKNYPADDYSVVFWSHATGWVPPLNSTDQATSRWMAPIRRSFGIDNGKNTTANTGDVMDVADMAAVLAGYPKFRCLMFDCCFMQSWEVAYALRDCADYLVGSPAEIPGPGAPYQKVMPLLFADSFNGASVAQAYNSYYTTNTYGGVMSSITLSEADEFARELRALLIEKADSLELMDFSQMLNYMDYDNYRYNNHDTSSTHIYMPDCYDLLAVLRQLCSGEELAAWQQRLAALASCFHSGYWYSSVMGNQSYSIDSEQCGGLSIYLPLAKYDENGEPFASAFQHTAWGSYWLGTTESY